MKLTAEECYAEALRRIAQERIELSGKLDLQGLHALQKLPTEIGQLLHLRELACGLTSVEELAPLSSLSALQSLDCSSTRVKDLQPLLPLKNLVALCVHNCVLTATNSSFFLQSALQKLSAADTHIPNIPNELLSKDLNDAYEFSYANAI